MFIPIKNLSLYHYHSCPYCKATRQEINRIGLEIPKLDIQKNGRHRLDLIHGGGKGQVPCLRIDLKNGSSQWLYESGQIIQFLRQYAIDESRAA